ncbi:MAG: hypothetical protein Q8O51_01615 [bacterium]|nr:hypothetical protein [bacterium]
MKIGLGFRARISLQMKWLAVYRSVATGARWVDLEKYLWKKEL